MPTDPQDTRPLSVQIASELSARIRVGQYPVGQRIPSLRALAGEFAVAELTVHAAVRELQREGVLVSYAGRGTFVQKMPGDAGGFGDLDQLRAEVEDLRRRVETLEQSERR